MPPKAAPRRPKTSSPRNAAASRPQASEAAVEGVFEIEKLVAGGLGLARDGKGAVLIAGALPGERVRAALRPGRGVRQGRALDILRTSPDRVPDAPDLPTTDLAHASYAAQLHFKRGFVTEALERIAKLGGAAEVTPTVPSGAQWGYRSGAQYLIMPLGLAYRERRAHQPHPAHHDPLLASFARQLLEKVDAALTQATAPESLEDSASELWRLASAQEIAVRGSFLTGEVLVVLIAPGEPRDHLRAAETLLDLGFAGVSLAAPAGRRFGSRVRLIAGESTVPERFGRASLPVSASGFAQVNPEAAGRAYRQVAEWAGRGSHAADLYGGAGAIGQHLSSAFGRVTVIDVAAEALSRGRQAAAEADLNNLQFLQGSAETLGELSTNVIVADPPRAGLDTTARDAIHASTADRLVYMSCDPATWARDVGDLVRRGWRLERVTPYDFYPQTSHTEVVSLLER